MTKREIDKLGMEFAKAMGHASIKGAKMKMEDGIELINRTAEPFLKVVAKNPDLLLELRRRVAESKVLLSTEHERPFPEVESYYEALRRLGFTDLANKVTYTIIFARYCLRHDNTEKGLHLLKQLQREANNHARFYLALKRDVDKAMEMAKARQE